MNDERYELDQEIIMSLFILYCGPGTWLSTARDTDCARDWCGHEIHSDDFNLLNMA